MKYLIDQPHDHDYIYINREIVSVELPAKKVLKDSYACVHCGIGMDSYNLDEPGEI